MKLATFTATEKAARMRGVEVAISSQGLSLRRACWENGVSAASYSRWKKQVEEGGLDALAIKKPTGRPPAVRFDEFDLGRARWHRLTKESLPAAVHFYIHDPESDPAIVDKLRRIEERGLEAGKDPSYPMSVRRAFEVTEDEKARFRSKKAMHDTEMVTRRGLIWIDEEGMPQDLLPGDLWELDDYSANQPYTYLDPMTGELNLGRQILAGMDVGSAGWLGFDLIGRERDAYRGEDIVRFIARLLRSHGCPRFLRLERGSWDSSFIHGIDDGQGGKWGALDALTHIVHTWKSKGKGTIEGSFNPLQRWLGHAGRDIGRHAGEFESAAKAWRQAKSAKSKPDPRALGFWEQHHCAAGHEEAARLMNERPRTRKALGEKVSADDLRARLGWNTTPVPTAEAWRLLPVKDRRVLRAGHIIGKAGGGWPEMEFVVNGIDGLALETGHALFIAFDPADPTAGAVVANADISARNRTGFGFGQILLQNAPLAQLAPQIDLSGRKHGTLDLRRKAAAAASTEYRAITPGRTPGKREISVTNGHGTGATAGTLAPLEGREPSETIPASPAPATRREVAPLSPTDRNRSLADLEKEAMSHF